MASSDQNRIKLNPQEELKNGVFEVVLAVRSGSPSSLSRASLNAKIQTTFGAHVEVLDWSGRIENGQLRVLIRAGIPPKPSGGGGGGGYLARPQFVPLLLLTAAALASLFLAWKITLEVKEVARIAQKTVETPAGAVAAVASSIAPALSLVAAMSLFWFLSRKGGNDG
jgi:hypothetical protein